MIGRLIAGLVVLACIGVFIWSYGEGDARTLNQTLASLGLAEEPSGAITPAFREPGYEEREALAP